MVLVHKICLIFTQVVKWREAVPPVSLFTAVRIHHALALPNSTQDKVISSPERNYVTMAVAEENGEGTKTEMETACQ